MRYIHQHSQCDMHNHPSRPTGRGRKFLGTGFSQHNKHDMCDPASTPYMFGSLKQNDRGLCMMCWPCLKKSCYSRFLSAWHLALVSLKYSHVIQYVIPQAPSSTISTNKSDTGPAVRCSQLMCCSCSNL